MTIQPCAAIFMALILASVVMQFIRAKKRENIVRRLDQHVLPESDGVKWLTIEKSFDPFLKGFRKMQLVKKNMSRLPKELASEYGRYRFFSFAEMLVTGCMLLYGGFAFYFCG